jgi:dGTPase
LIPSQRVARFHQRDRVRDSRLEAQRDRDRVLYSSALRRLGHVTQVVSPTEGLVFHNRLTHSLEVAQIGRRIAERLVADEDGRRRSRRLGGMEPDVVETAALVHDLGHPPYGHAVEKELNRLVSERYEVHDGYEGNAQSFRIVTKLSMRYLNVSGLNLTRASLNAALKYPWLRSTEPGARNSKKWGVYSTEKEEFDWVRRSHSGRPDGASAEAALMDWADDVAYAVHDADDFYRAGLVPIHRLRIPENYQDHEVDRFAKYAAPKLRKEPGEVKETLRSVVGSSPIVEPYSGTNVQRQQLRTFTAGLINSYANGVSLAETPDDEELIKIPPVLRDQVDVLKELTWFYVIDDRSLKVQQHGQRKVVRELFDIYMQASEDEDRDTLGIFPVSQQEQMQNAATQEERVRIVADLISSMTERQLMITHRKLTGTEPGSITDLI